MFLKPFGVWGRLWNLIVSVPDHCLFPSVLLSDLIEVFTGNRHEKNKLHKAGVALL